MLILVCDNKLINSFVSRFQHIHMLIVVLFVFDVLQSCYLLVSDDNLSMSLYEGQLVYTMYNVYLPLIKPTNRLIFLSFKGQGHYIKVTLSDKTKLYLWLRFYLTLTLNKINNFEMVSGVKQAVNHIDLILFCGFFLFVVTSL